MMTMMFSSFDLFFYSFPFTLGILFSVIFTCNFYSAGYKKASLNIVLNSLIKFYSELNQKFLPKMFVFFLMATMLNTFYVNFMSIHPYIFAFTSQISGIFPVIFTLWLGTVVFMILKYNKSFFSHSIPQGCPMYLAMFLFLIELVSMLIRPITGTMRLLANIMAGHLLMILLSKVVMLIFPTIISYIVLNIAEMMVAAIQAYIFFTMIALYMCDLR